MRLLIAVLVFVAMISSMVSAECMTTANTFGKGIWGVELALTQDQNFANNSSFTNTALGGFVGYGLKKAIGRAERER